ncbi:MAG: PBSX family phage terminase large subunit, partial [Ruminococcus sp.]|nr:PBSX family phage terminase large subunit [Ruminococcus sp.]
MKQVMDMLLQMPADTRADYDMLVEMGIDVSELDPDTVNNMLVVNAALLRLAKTGDVQAIKELRSIIEDDAYLKHKIKYENSKLKLEKEKIIKPAPVTAEYKGIPASLIAPAFSQVLFDIADHEHTEYVFPGGRGSTKSTFVGINLVDQLMKNEEMHALALRQYSNTLKDSVYNQILWSISALGLDDEFDYTKSPLEITRKQTGQKIFFRGADDPNKVKSIKPDFGYIGVLWFEELDQFHGADEVRKIEQSAIRGGDVAYIFKSFNPPKSAMNWANQYIKIPKDTRLVTMSDYLTVPKKWLGKPFLEEAEFLKETNPDAYANEYLGEANGSGGNIFENVVIREITDEE